MFSPRLRAAAFCVAYLALQGFMVVRAHFREDKRFGFWMFAESSFFTARLSRETFDGKVEPAPRGIWTVQGLSGEEVRYRWIRWVRDFRLGDLEKRQRAKVGLHVTLKYMKVALDYVAARIPQDRETRRLGMEVRYQKAGGPEQTIMLWSEPRGLDPGGTEP